MPNPDAIRWFKTQFETKIEAAIHGTPFSVDMITAIACQETGFIWNVLRKKLSTDEVLRLCVGDTIDSKPDGKGRKAFPVNKAALVAVHDGQEMFDIARKALLDMASHINGYTAAVNNASKFCRGFGIFQYDLQAFKTDPNYFLQKRYANFDHSLGKAINELKAKLAKLGWQNRTSLTDMEMCAVAIAYNTGGYKPDKGLKQGHFDGTKYYGEQFHDYLILSKSVTLGPPIPIPPAPLKEYIVTVTASPLNVRSTPAKPAPGSKTNVVATLPNGHHVKRLDASKVGDFVHIETTVGGKTVRGYCSITYLKLA
jgi:hypothetical protein